MNYIVRKILFILFVTLFIVAAPSLILYAQGYRLNLPLTPGGKLIVKTGGIYLKVDPKQAEVYINGQLSEKTDYFFKYSLVENLLPRQYRVEVKKSGYQTWQKDLDVKEKEVTEARNILLFPDKLGFKSAEENIEDILVSPDLAKIALRGQNADGWNLRLYDLAQGVTSKLADQGDFSAKDAALSGWKWSADSKALEVPVTSDKTTVDYAIITDKTPAQINKIAKDNTTATSTQDIAIYIAGNANFYLAPDGYIYKKQVSGTPEIAVKAKMEIDQNSQYSLRVFDNYYFVGKGKELYVLTPGTEEFKKIFDSLAAAPEISPDGGKVVYYSDSEIWIFFLNDKTNQPVARAGDKQFLIRLSEKISDCHWLNSNYLIFLAGQTVKTAEIDNRDGVNIFNLAKVADITGGEPQGTARLFWDGRNRIAYLFTNKTLYQSNPIE